MTAPLHLVILYLDKVLKKVDDIAQYEIKGYSGSSSYKKGCYHPYEKPSKSFLDVATTRKVRASFPVALPPPPPPRGSVLSMAITV